MPGKINLLRLSVFFLALVTGAACLGAEPMRFSVDLTKAFSERLNDQLSNSLKTRELSFAPFPAKQLGLCGGTYVKPPIMGLWQHHCCGFVDLDWSKFRILRTYDISNAFLWRTSINLVILETSVRVPPKWAGILRDDITDDYLVLNKTETSEAYAARIMQMLLGEARDPDAYEGDEVGNDSSVEEAVKRCKDYYNFVPSLTIEIKGAYWLRVEINKEQQIGFLQNSEGWGLFKIDKATAESLVTYAKSICELENAHAR